MLNKVILLGNVGRDPEVRHLEGGSAVANFTLATSEKFRDKSGIVQDRTEWHNIVCWGPLADRAEKYIKKGTQLLIEGKIRTRDYTAKDGQKRYVTEIFADSLQFVGRKSDNPASSNNATTNGGNMGGNIRPEGQAYQSTPTNIPTNTQPSAPEDVDFGAGDTDDLPF